MRQRQLSLLGVELAPERAVPAKTRSTAKKVLQKHSIQQTGPLIREQPRWHVVGHQWAKLRDIEPGSRATGVSRLLAFLTVALLTPTAMQLLLAVLPPAVIRIAKGTYRVVGPHVMFHLARLTYGDNIVIPLILVKKVLGERLDGSNSELIFMLLLLHGAFDVRSIVGRMKHKKLNQLVQPKNRIRSHISLLRHLTGLDRKTVHKVCTKPKANRVEAGS